MATNTSEIRNDTSIATVVESSILKTPTYSENTTSSRIGTSGRRAKMPGTAGRSASSTFSVL